MFIEIRQYFLVSVTEKVTASLAKRLKIVCLRLQGYIARTAVGNQGGIQTDGLVIQVLNKLTR